MQPLDLSMTQSMLPTTGLYKPNVTQLKPQVPRSEPIMFPISKENVPPPLPPRRLNPLPLSWSSSTPPTDEFVDRVVIISETTDPEDFEWTYIDDWMDISSNPTLCDSDQDVGWAKVDVTNSFVNQRQRLQQRHQNSISRRFPCLTEFGNLGTPHTLPVIQEGEEIYSPNAVSTRSPPIDAPTSISQDGFGYENKMDQVPLYAGPAPVMFFPGAWGY